MLTRAEARAISAVDEQALVDLLVRLVAVPSVGGSDAEIEVQHVLSDVFRKLDLDVDLWRMDLPVLTADPGYPGMEVERTEAWGLVGVTEAARCPALILQGHADVVPAGNEYLWTGDPFKAKVTAGRVVGRGACDMKSGLVANIAALQAIRAAGIRLRSPLSLQSVIGEEDGGLGAFGTLQRGHHGASCIISEPTNGKLVTANAGALTFRIEVSGLATHGSTRYAGSSAIDTYVRLHSALTALEQRRNTEPEWLMTEYPIPYPLSVGQVQAGDWSSSVPDYLVAEGRLGLRIEEEPTSARAEFEDVVRAVADADPWLREHPPRVTWLGGQFRGGQLTPGHPLLDVVAEAHAAAVRGPLPEVHAAPYGSDLRLYAGAGIPTLHYGPGDIWGAHGPDESVLISEIVTVVHTLILTVMRTCGADGD